jgi:hypothetical protein
MTNHLEQLQAMCRDDLRGIPPFQVRTRFERHIFGLATSFSESLYGASPAGLSRRHIEHFAERVRSLRPIFDETDLFNMQILSRICVVFEKFTSLCDSSNWSDDGQDPRIEWCRQDILELCEKLSPTQSGSKQRRG